MRLVVVRAPEPIISVPEVKERLAIDTSGDVLEPLVAAACAQIEPPLGWTGRAFGRQTLEWRGDWRTGLFSLCGLMLTPPVVSITSVKYLDGSGVEQTLSPSVYELLGDRVALAYGQSWPTVWSLGQETIRVRFEAGYEIDDPRLELARNAVALMVKAQLALGVEDVFLRSETVDGIGSQSRAVTDTAIALMAKSAENLLHPYRVY